MDFNALLKQIDSVNTKKTYDKDSGEFWKPTKDKDGNAQALIRFLPDADIEGVPFQRRYSHSFKDPITQRWYIENSLSTLGKSDYIAEENAKLWATGTDENKEIVRARKRKLNFISNILVIKDSANKENEGKVFKFSYGKKIWDKIAAAAKPDAEMGEEPINAFDPIKGADFLLKQTVVAGWPNFDSSKFSSKKPLFEADQDKINAVLAKCYDLTVEVSEAKFKTQDELKDKFLWVTGKKDTAKAEKNYDKELDTLQKAAAEPAKSTMKTPDFSAKVEDEDFDYASLLND